MKVKHFLSGATLLSAALLLNAPLSAAVESDTVGYTTVELTRQYTLVGINFSALDGSDSLPVNDVVSGNFSNGDQLQLQDGSGSYIVLRWENDAWCDNSGSVAEVSVKRGSGVWLVANGASEASPVIAQLKGGVNLSDTLTTSFGQQYVIAATGLPVDTTVNSALFTWENLSPDDQLQVPDGNGSYIVLRWRDGKWYGGNSDAPAAVSIPKESAIWLVSTNPTARVTVNPAVL